MTLDKLLIGETARIASLGMAGVSRRRMMDRGFTPGAHIIALHKGRGGYPAAYLVRGCVIALREEEVRAINVKLVYDTQ